MKKRKYRLDCELDTITMAYFVREYLGTDHTCENLRHCGLKKFGNPLVISISNDVAFRNLDLIRKRDILVVKDSRGDLASYINPNLLKSIFQISEIDDQLKELFRKKIVGLENLNQFYESVTKRIEILKKEKEFLENMYCLEVFRHVDDESKIDELYSEVYGLESGVENGAKKLRRKAFSTTNENGHR